MQPCPTCDQIEWTVQDERDPTMLHWKLNPGLVFNEVLLGQRIPAEMWVCKACDLPRQERTWIPCTACGTLHANLLWGKGNAFGHWTGLWCPHCCEEIPCLRNVAALGVEKLLTPLRWVLRPLIPTWRRREIEAATRHRLVKHERPRWIRTGIVKFGGGLFAVLYGLPAATVAGAIAIGWLPTGLLGALLVGALPALALCLVGGFVWGAVMHHQMTRRG